MMRTHRLAGVALALLLVGVALRQPLTITFLAVAAALLTDTAIDALGHRRKGNVPTRTWLTHTPLTAAAAGALTALAVALTFRGLTRLPVDPSLIILAGVLASQAHMALDAVTGGGIYLTRTRRLALAHLRYNNPALNTAIGLASLLSVASSLIMVIHT